MRIHRVLGLFACIGLVVACSDEGQGPPEVMSAAEPAAVGTVADDSPRLDPDDVIASESSPLDLLAWEEQDTPVAILTIQALPGMPALPGVDGYAVEVQYRPEFPQLLTEHIVVRLAVEAIDRLWASDMERKIREEMAVAIDEPMTVIGVECRTTMCGVLLETPPGSWQGGPHGAIMALLGGLGFDRLGGGLGGRDGDRDWFAFYGTYDP